MPQPKFISTTAYKKPARMERLIANDSTNLFVFFAFLRGKEK
jgi:hypothetical protein